MILGHQQQQAIDAIGRWLKSDQQTFRLFGYAGAGKSTLAAMVPEMVNGPTLFCAFTGKAALVLKQKGCSPAFTIHQLIYCPKERSKARLMDLEAALASADDPVEAARLQADIDFENKKLASPNFILNDDSPVREADLLVVDEASMVNQQVAQDLLSFGTKILILGDPAQLPPVFGKGEFIAQQPDAMLTDIHRQALDNPIIRLAARIRNRESLEPDGDMVVSHGSISPDEALSYDQLIVGRNVTRKAANARIRELKGMGSDYPVDGDRLVCLRNDHEIGLLNGGIWTVTTCMDDGGNTIDLIITDGEETLAVEAHKHCFVSDAPMPWWLRKTAQEFDYGYALTCHKSQGSQFDSVLVFDESDAFGNDKFRWLYTAVTRAVERVKVVV